VDQIGQEIAAAAERAKQAQSLAKQTGRQSVTLYSEDRDRREISARICESGLGTRFRSCTFEVIEKRGVPASIKQDYPLVKGYAKNLPKHIKDGTGLLLKGPVGTMKTSLAAAVLLEHIYGGGRGLFISMSSLLDTIFSLKAKNADNWAKFEHDLRNISLLVIDDLGAEFTEGWVLTKVDSIIGERYNNLRPVIITTNMSNEELKKTYAERMIDRIRSTVMTVNFEGKSLRTMVG
jgi:DNA replication protein DnaC